MRVLVVEDEERLARIIQRVLKAEAIEAEVAGRGDTGLARAQAGGFDALVIDRMLPGIDGLTLVRELRASSVETPVLLLTALTELPDRVEGLDAGADDYLGKPFAFEELIARLRALARRGDRALVDHQIEAGALTIDLGAREVRRGSELLALTRKEFALLEALARNRARVLSRDELLDRVWGADADPVGNVVELYVHYLRRKLDPPGTRAAASLIRTVRGCGYQLRLS